ncbi:hypothetical protein Q3G72_030576 [Acer saccharum]|nr:hypothetical protein Q3G72_030576 [Acer saccharum]
MYKKGAAHKLCKKVRAAARLGQCVGVLRTIVQELAAARYAKGCGQPLFVRTTATRESARPSVRDARVCPAATAARIVHEAYEKWVSENEKSCIYLLASMTEVLYTKHEAMTTTYEMMESLQAMFGQPSEQKQHKAICSAMIAHMKEGSSIREHVLGMMSHFNTKEVNGGTINEACQVSIILTTLTKSFDQFKRNYGMNKLKFNLTQLLNELTTFESMFKDNKSKTGEANIVEPLKVYKRS